MTIDPLTAAFAALADPTRRAILARLAEGEASVTDIAKPFALSLPAISKHLKVLEQAGLVTRSRDAQWRPCRLNPAALRAASDWLDHYRRFWESNFDGLETYLDTLRTQGAPRATPSDATKRPATPLPDTRTETRHARSRSRKQ